MKTEETAALVSWMRSTDLVELSYRRGKEGFEFRLDGAASSDAGVFPSSSLIAVTSPAVGFFRFATPGTPRHAVPGRAIEKDASLGLIETGGKPTLVTAPQKGRLIKILVDDGNVVEYGQLLFLLAP